MALQNIFSKESTEESLARLEKLGAITEPQWGKMNASQMLAHLNVAYDMANGKVGSRPNFLIRFMMKLFVKDIVVGEKPYQKNNRTAPEFVISDERDFEKEKAKLIANIKEVEKLGVDHFDGKESLSFGNLSSAEWSNLFYKHMDHHFVQFGI